MRICHNAPLVGIISWYTAASQLAGNIGPAKSEIDQSEHVIHKWPVVEGYNVWFIMAGSALATMAYNIFCRCKITVI